MSLVASRRDFMPVPSGPCTSSCWGDWHYHRAGGISVTDDYEPRDDEIDPQLNEGGKPATEYPEDDAIDDGPEDDPETSPEVPTP